MRNLRDVQSVFYIAAYIGLAVTQCTFGFGWLPFCGLLFFSICMHVVHHNHIHLGIWHSKTLNNTTNLLISATTAVPSAMMYGGHLKNHHVHEHGPEDVTRTYRFGGDHNHLAGYFMHPFQAAAVLIPKFWRDFKEQWPARTRFSRDLLIQTFLIGLTWLILLIADWQKFLLLVIVPQAFGMHWLLAANYLQHAHCDDESENDGARNFTGAVNWIWLNIGFHTAHHNFPKTHWSRLREMHIEHCNQVDSRLCCNSFLAYVVRTFLLSMFFKSYRSDSLKNEHSISDIEPMKTVRN